MVDAVLMQDLEQRLDIRLVAFNLTTPLLGFCNGPREYVRTRERSVLRGRP
jgi:hypothetical protein